VRGNMSDSEFDSEEEGGAFFARNNRS
jgi:hypothetical protein